MCPEDEDRTVPDRPGSRSAARSQSPSDRYQLLEPIGRGGMGEVIAARDENIGREVAIKRMISDEPSPATTTRFLREARIQGRLDHPAIAPVYELAYDREDRPFFVMKRLRGTTLKEIFERRDTVRYPRQRLLRALVDVCLAVELAHTRGVIHRDLKPSNIMLGDFGEVYVLDWGVAKVRGDTSSDSLGDVTGDGDTTIAGSVVGTPTYMAPEQQRASEIDHRIDVYALGCVLFELLSGTQLHTSARRPTDLDTRPSHRAPHAEIPPELDELVVAATQSEPEDRIATARDLGDAIQRFLDGDRDLERRRALARDHLARAAAALPRTGDEARAIAMREAGRAIALDPTLTAAADIVSRLMLEPPTTTPVEVESEIAAETLASNARYAKVALLGYFGYLLFLPELLWVGVRNAQYLAAFTAILGLNIAIALLGINRRIPIRPRLVLVVVGNALMIATVARMFSPLILGPGIAAATISAIVPNPVVRTARMATLCTAVVTAAVLVPFVAEIAGLIPPTMWVQDETLMIQSPALRMSAAAVEIGLALYSVALVAFSGLMAWTAARGERAAKRRLHLQAWQLRQLVGP